MPRNNRMNHYTGALTIAGGVGVAGALHVSGGATVSKTVFVDKSRTADPTLVLRWSRRMLPVHEELVARYMAPPRTFPEPMYAQGGSGFKQWVKDSEEMWPTN